VFVLKHTLIYILVASVIVMLIKKIYRHVLHKYGEVFVDKKLYFLKGFTILVMMILLGLSRYLQLDYIKLYETPPIRYCYFYDEYGNYIHGSRIYNVCPQVEVLSKTEDSLIFRAEYIYPGNRQDRLRNEHETPYYQGKTGYGIVDVVIKYNTEHYITSYSSQTSINYELYEFENEDSLKDKSLINDEAIKQYYHSLLLTIETDYSQDLVSQTKKLYVKKPEHVKFDDVSEIEHVDFAESDLSYEDSKKIQVTKREDHRVEFEVYRPIIRDEEHVLRLTDLGSIKYEQDKTELFVELNTELNRVTRSITYTISDDRITRLKLYGPYGPFDYTDEFTKVKDYGPMIQTYFSSSHNGKESSGYGSKVYELNDSVVVETGFRTHKMYPTSYGYKVEEYHGDGSRAEVPYSDEDFLTRWFIGMDNDVLAYNPIVLEYSGHPIMNLNPMLQYLIDQNK
jgi:hypothetical protein